MKEYKLKEVSKLTGYSRQYLNMILKASTEKTNIGECKKFVRSSFKLNPDVHFRKVDVISRIGGVYLINEKGLELLLDKANRRGKWNI